MLLPHRSHSKIRHKGRMQREKWSKIQIFVQLSVALLNAFSCMMCMPLILMLLEKGEDQTEGRARVEKGTV